VKFEAIPLGCTNHFKGLLLLLLMLLLLLLLLLKF